MNIHKVIGRGVSTPKVHKPPPLISLLGLLGDLSTRVLLKLCIVLWCTQLYSCILGDDSSLMIIHSNYYHDKSVHTYTELQRHMLHYFPLMQN